MYTMYDRVSQVFSEMVFRAHNDEDAKRSFGSFIKNNKDIDPLHYSLFFVGEYDRVDGKVKGVENGNNEYVCAGVDFIKVEKEVIDEE